MPANPAPKHLLSDDDARRVRDAIADAESKTSAELKLIIARHCWGDIRDKAHTLFIKHGLDQTQQRNAVMILLVTTNREFLVYGDQGIHEKVGDAFWQATRDVMAHRFKAGAIGDGLVAGIEQIAARLGEHFPITTDDVNEISNEVAYDD
jgi:uncharacterized membrane protein